MLPKDRRPIHPGEILKHEFLEPLNMTQQQLADAIGVTWKNGNFFFPCLDEMINFCRN